ncbi:MAG: septum formation initiator family protein [bacterium]
METRFIVRFILFFGLLILLFYFLFFSSSGIIKYLKAKHCISMENQKIFKLEEKIENINKSINDWSAGGFELEKQARQDLQMGSKGETVYLLK